VGAYALYANLKSYNSAFGNNALRFNSNGMLNSAFGSDALKNNTTGSYNTAFGQRALYSNTTGSSNTAIGRSAFASGTNYSNSTAIGYNAAISSSNRVRLGNSSVSSISGYANWTNASDGRFKTNIQENIAGLDFIMKLRPVSYNLDMNAIASFNNTPDSLRLPESEALKAAEIQTGFIAQEVEAAAQEVGFDFHGVDAPKNANDHYGLRYAEFVVPLVKAMQEQQKEIEELRIKANKVDDLQRQIDELRELIEQR
jgi:hypothetical protein